jgi:hypothetical protein
LCALPGFPVPPIQSPGEWKKSASRGTAPIFGISDARDVHNTHAHRTDGHNLRNAGRAASRRPPIRGTGHNPTNIPTPKHNPAWGRPEPSPLPVLLPLLARALELPRSLLALAPADQTKSRNELRLEPTNLPHQSGRPREAFLFS